jgi:hypothetical protein
MNAPAKLMTASYAWRKKQKSHLHFAETNSKASYSALLALL